MSTIENGQVNLWSYPASYAMPDEFWQKYFAPYLRTLKAEQTRLTVSTASGDGSTDEKDSYKIYFQDGTTLFIYSAGDLDFFV